MIITFVKTISMYKITLVALITILLLACQSENSNSPKFIGNAKNVKDSTEVIVYSTSEENNLDPVDTVTVQNEKIEFELPEVDNQRLYLLKVGDLKGNVIFINENKDVKASIYKDSLRSSEITSGKNNDLLQEYLGMVQKMGAKMKAMQGDYRSARMKKELDKAKEIRKKQSEVNDEYIEKQKTLVKENSNSLVALMILSDLYQQKRIPSNESKKLYQSLSADIQDTPIGKKINEQLEKTSKTDIGEIAPKFSAPNPQGKEVSLEDAMGKITLIDFWASWCKPCRIENPNVVKLYNEYHDDGFNIIGVSLDKSKSKWVKAIKDDQLDWYHISNLKAWSEPIAQKYGIRSIPKTYLIDDEGKIIAKNLRGGELREKVAELLGDS